MEVIQQDRAEWVKVHPLVVRVTHWINAFAILVMVASGWRIYNASPLFGFRFPNEVTLGGWLAGALQWHFAAMWLLVLNGIVYVTYGIVSGHFRRKLLPLTPRAVLRDVLAALRGKLAHDDLAVYNAAQRAAYLAIILCLVVLVFSGLAIWKPVQLQEIAALMGGYEGARFLHFFAMALMVFIVLRAHRHGDCGAAQLSDDDHRPSKESIMKKRTMETSLADQSPKLIRSIERRLFLKQGLSLGALALLSGCDLTDDENVQKLLLGMSRWNDGVQAWLFDPEQARAGVSGERDHQALSLQRLLPRGRGARRGRGELRARTVGPHPRPEALDAARALRPAADFADHASHLRRGLERDRQVERRALFRFPRAHRRRHHGEIHRLRVRRRLHHEHRHGDRAAPADAAHLPLRRPDSFRPSTASR